MNVWIQRGLRTALLTGGLLALGTGAAAADDSSIDVTAPVTVSGTAVAVSGDATAVGSTGTAGGSGGDGSTVDVAAPVTVCGTGVGVVGDASAACTTAGGAAGDSGGDGSTVAVAAPITVSGTGVGVVGDASAGWSAPGATAEAGTATPSGAGGVAPHWSGPLQVASASRPLPADGVAARTSGTSGAIGGELAYTGTELALPVLVGLVTLALGLGLTVASRRRLAGTVV
jgi:hypothetical protein